MGSEHPLCDSLQLTILILYFAAWAIDSLSHFVFEVSTVPITSLSFPPLLLPAFLSWSLGIYLLSKSHESIFGEEMVQPRLNDKGVYSWVRHPMYLGTLMFCLGFLFVMPSILSLALWVAFFVFYDKMATYEERDLIQILGEEYVNYQRRVPKWRPRWQKRKTN